MTNEFVSAPNAIPDSELESNITHCVVELRSLANSLQKLPESESVGAIDTQLTAIRIQILEQQDPELRLVVMAEYQKLSEQNALLASSGIESQVAHLVRVAALRLEARDMDGFWEDIEDIFTNTNTMPETDSFSGTTFTCQLEELLNKFFQ